jgi:hypothetical protein
VRALDIQELVPICSSHHPSPYLHLLEVLRPILCRGYYLRQMAAADHADREAGVQHEKMWTVAYLGPPAPRQVWGVNLQVT